MPPPSDRYGRVSTMEYGARMAYRLDAVVGEFDRLRAGPEGRRRPWSRPSGSGWGRRPSPPGSATAFRTCCGTSLGRACGPCGGGLPGGDGERTAAVWRGGAREWGPVRASEFGGPREERPIDATLARLGVAPSGPGAPDRRGLFAEAGLGRGRNEEHWRRAALDASGAAGTTRGTRANGPPARRRKARRPNGPAPDGCPGFRCPSTARRSWPCSGRPRAARWEPRSATSSSSASPPAPGPAERPSPRCAPGRRPRACRRRGAAPRAAPETAPGPQRPAPGPVFETGGVHGLRDQRCPRPRTPARRSPPAHERPDRPDRELRPGRVRGRGSGGWPVRAGR